MYINKRIIFIIIFFLLIFSGCSGDVISLGNIVSTDDTYYESVGLINRGRHPMQEITLEGGDIWILKGIDRPPVGHEAFLRWSVWKDSRGYIEVDGIEYDLPIWYRKRIKRMFNKIF